MVLAVETIALLMCSLLDNAFFACSLTCVNFTPPSFFSCNVLMECLVSVLLEFKKTSWNVIIHF